MFKMGIPVTPKNFFPSNISGLPTWYVGEAPEPPPPPRRPATRVVVYELTERGLDDRVAAVVTASVTAELRKLSGLSVIGSNVDIEFAWRGGAQSPVIGMQHHKP